MSTSKNIIKISTYKNLQYATRYPKDFKQTETYPLILALHGAGGRGNNIELLTGNPFFTETEMHNLNAIIVAPQCFADSWFEIFEQLQEFAEYIASQSFCDKNRVYLMGASMGGYATWQLAMTKPGMFAAIVPICGGGMYWNAARLKNIPVWAFHGDSDPTVYPEESKKMVDAVNNCGGNAKLTIYPNTEHNAWTPTYRNAELFKWLFGNVKEECENSGDCRYNDQKLFG